MKQLTQAEFEKQIERILIGDISRKKLAKELDTDIRTLNTKIVELSKTNPELYKKYIKKFPYRPKEIKVDIEALAIRIIKEGKEKVAVDTGISSRTISRKMKLLEKTDPELYDLYVSRNAKMNAYERECFNARLSEMSRKYGFIVVRNELEEKERQLRATLAEFEELVAKGMDKAEAARTMGYDNYPTIWKKYQELKRIENEKAVKQEEIRNKQERLKEKGKKEQSDFKARIKVDVSHQEPIQVQRSEAEKVEIRKEEMGRGKEED